MIIIQTLHEVYGSLKEDESPVANAGNNEIMFLQLIRHLLNTNQVFLNN